MTRSPEGSFRRAGSLAAWGLAIMSAVIAGTVLTLAHLNGQTVVEMVTSQTAFSAMFGVAFPLVGAMIAWRLPNNPVGWILIGVGLSQVVAILSGQYVAYAQTHPALPLVAGIAFLGEILWVTGLPLLSLLFLIFPYGTLPSGRWRPVIWLIALGVLLLGVVIVLEWPNRFEYLREGEVPPSPLVELLGGIGFLAFLVGLVLGLVALVLRFRRSRGSERQQMKWFTYGAVVIFLSFFTTDLLGPAGAVVTLLLVPVLPASIGVAILRYRLYDIDLVINRTLVYGGLTGFLGLVYVGAVVGLSQLVPGEDNDPAVAAATLAVAALFSPARRRIQAFVDRRFYRSRYDARQTLEGFGSRLREEVELETLMADLQGVVRDTLHPSSVGIWLREGR